MSIPPEAFFLDPAAEGTKQLQIRETVARGVLSGRFQPGVKLPSSRGLAKHLGISRITVTLAYTELLADDYITTRDRSGYYISENAPVSPRFQPNATRSEDFDWGRKLTTRTSESVQLSKPSDWRSYDYPFIYGQADESLFDRASWRLCAIRALGAKDFEDISADQFDQDDARLVQFIADHTLPRRGIQAGPDEILITLGAQNALWLAAQLLLTQRRRAAIENPCYPALRDLLAGTRCHVSAINVDSDGLPPHALPPDTDVVFTTPSHQCPTTRTMPLERRKALLKAAGDEDFLIVEDDYEFEMSFLKPPSPALKSLDTTGRVIYVGSFSKSLFPGIRLGYLVGAPDFIAEARRLRSAVLRHPPGLLQRTVAYFLSLGHFDAMNRRIATAFRQRRVALDDTIAASSLKIAGRGRFGGSSVWMQAPAHIDTVDLARHLQPEKVLIEPGAPFFSNPSPPKNFYRLAYSSIPAAQIPEGLGRIERTIAKM
ncbi:MAG: PLP-dependent aminotransferase family protein [Pseudomonadota bacterium]